MLQCIHKFFYSISILLIFNEMNEMKWIRKHFHIEICIWILYLPYQSVFCIDTRWYQLHCNLHHENQCICCNMFVMYRSYKIWTCPWIICMFCLHTCWISISYSSILPVCRHLQILIYNNISIDNVSNIKFVYVWTNIPIHNCCRL